MLAPKANRDQSVLVVVDLQPTFMAGIYDRERVLERTKFLVQAAGLMNVPVLATEQYPERMGGTDETLTKLIGSRPFPKMSFSCCGCEDFASALALTGRKQAILVGIETHICVSQTAVDLINQDFEVLVCPDAVSSRSLEMHKLGMERMRDSGVWPFHTESVVYEWMETAENPRFRDVLKLVKGS